VHVNHFVQYLAVLA